MYGRKYSKNWYVLNTNVQNYETHTTKSHSRMLAGEGIKGKAIPLQAWTGPDSYRRLKLPDLKTIGT